MNNIKETLARAQQLADFVARYGYLVTNALSNLEREQREAAAQALAAAYCPAAPPQPGKEGYISLVPGPDGLRRMAGALAESAVRYGDALQAWDKLSDFDEDDEEEQA